MTNVITLEFNPGAFYMDLFPEVPLDAYKTGARYPQGEQRPSPHDLYHGLKTDFFNNNYNSRDYVNDYARKFDHRYQRMGADLAAKIATELKATPEGNGTMLDNTVIVWMSHSGGGHHVSGDRARVTTVGNIARNPMQTGVYHNYNKGEHSMREFWVALGTQMGVDMSNFGKGTKEKLNKLVKLK